MSRQSIVILTYPKSGSTHTARLLGDILDSPVKSNTHGREKNAIADEGFDRPGKFEIKQWHGLLKGEPDNALLTYVYRDPRDVCLSVRDYWRMSSLDAVLFNKNTKPPNPVAPLRGWQAHLDNYFHRCHSYTSYELLRTNPVQTLRVMLMELGIEGYNDRIKDAVERQSIENRKKMITNDMPYGSEVQSHLIEHGGRLGAWKDEWKRHHGEAVHEEWWYWMNNLLIEKDEEWWKNLPEEGEE